MQHSNDMFMRIRGFDTPEQISKWKEERKSKYPTTTLIEEKRKEKLERIKSRQEKRCQEMKARESRNDLPESNNLDASELNNVPHNGNHQNKNNRRNKKPRLERNRNQNQVENQIQEVESNDVQHKQKLKPKPVFKTTEFKNVSPLIVLHNYFIKIDINENKKLIGARKVKWTCSKEEIEEPLDGDNELASDEIEAHITDEEDDMHEITIKDIKPEISKFESSDCKISAAKAFKKLGDNPHENPRVFSNCITKIEVVKLKSSSEVEMDNEVKPDSNLFGLVSYSSDSDDNMEGNNK